MPPPATPEPYAPSALSQAAGAMRAALSVLIREADVSFGPPSETSEVNEDGVKLGLFFYRVEHGATPADTTALEPYNVRIFCLVTAFGKSNGSGVSAGELELRLMGNVLAFFHSHPMLLVSDSGSTAPAEPVANLQVVPTPLTIEAMNNLWSTQKDVSYRLSVAYELALVPLGLRWIEPPAQSPLVVDVASRLPALSIPQAQTPELSFIAENGEQTQLIHTRVAASQLAIRMIASGASGIEVELTWERWSPTTRRFEVVSPAPCAQLSTGMTARVALDRGEVVQWVVTGRIRNTSVETNRLLIVVTR